MKVFPIRTFERRFRDILAELDELAQGTEDGGDLEELNAEFEDALMLLSTIDPEDEDWREQLEDALEELDALAAQCRDLAAHLPELDGPAERFGLAVKLASDNL